MLKISVVSKCQQSCSLLIKVVQLFSVVRRVFDSLAAGTAYKTSSVGFSRNPSWASDSRCATGHCRQFSRRRWGMVASHTHTPTLYLSLSVSLSLFVCVDVYVYVCLGFQGFRGIGEQGARRQSFNSIFLVHKNSKCVQVKASGATERDARDVQRQLEQGIKTLGWGWAITQSANSQF